MDKVDVLIKISPHDGTWDTAQNMLEDIKTKCKENERFSFEVDGVYSITKPSSIGNNTFNFHNVKKPQISNVVNFAGKEK